MTNEQIDKPNEHAAGTPLPPAVSRRGGHSSRESHDHNLVPPFKGKTAFQPVFVRTRVEIVDQALNETPVAEPLRAVVEESEPATVDASLQTADAEILELTAEVAAVEQEGTLDVQDLFATEFDQPEAIASDADLATELTLSPEFEQAPVLSDDPANNGHDRALSDVAIQELGAFIAPPEGEEVEVEVEFEPEPEPEPAPAPARARAKELDISPAALAAMAAAHDALEFEPLVAVEPSPPPAPQAVSVPEPVNAARMPEARMPAAEVPAPAVAQVEEKPEPVVADAADELPESTILEAVKSSGLAHHELADRLQRLSQRLRTETPEELLPSLARGDRFEVLIAGLLAGYLAARNE